MFQRKETPAASLCALRPHRMTSFDASSDEQAHSAPASATSTSNVPQPSDGLAAREVRTWRHRGNARACDSRDREIVYFCSCQAYCVFIARNAAIGAVAAAPCPRATGL